MRWTTYGDGSETAETAENSGHSNGLCCAVEDLVVISLWRMLRGLARISLPLTPEFVGV